MRKLSLFLAILMILAMLTPIVVRAEENTYGNAWVYDDANVVSAETEEYIRNLNESVFVTYKGKPQLAFIVLKKLPYNIDNYKIDMFNEYGVGTKEENHGMLFIFAIDDREYALEIGDGFEKGSILRKDLETDFITADMKNSLRNGDYDIVVKQIAEYLANKMLDEENGVYAQKEAEAVVKAEEAAKAKAEATAAAEKFFTIVAFVLCGGCVIAGIVFLVQHLHEKSLRKRAINNMMEKYTPHIALLKDDIDTVYRRIKADIENESPNCTPTYIEDAFPRLLCRYYVEDQQAIVNEKAQQSTLENSINTYHLAIAGANQADSFAKMRVFDAESMIKEVDEEEREKAEFRKKNNEAVEKFLEANMCRVGSDELKEKILSRFINSRSIANRLVTFSELNEHFEKSLKELSFEMEFERFCAEHKDEIDSRYFDKKQFYNELLKNNNYQQYRYRLNHTYNNMWMMHFFMLHMATQKKNVERREREEQEARERRRREEEAARQRQRMQQNNHSFGTSFGGGFSSGGGFKGGW